MTLYLILSVSPYGKHVLNISDLVHIEKAIGYHGDGINLDFKGISRRSRELNARFYLKKCRLFDAFK